MEKGKWKMWKKFMTRIKNYNWGKASEKKIVSALKIGDAGAQKKRIAAFERILTAGSASVRGVCGARSDFKKSSILVAEGTKLELPLLKAEPGIALIEITQKANSTLSLNFLQNLGATEHSMTIIRISLERDAELQTFAAMIGGASSSLIIETRLEGEKSSVHERMVYFGSSAQVFDMFSSTILTGTNTRAQIESKGILTDNARARYDGAIVMKKTCNGADANLNENTLLLSPTAQMNAIPGLKIETNNVTASHSASMTRVDDEQLFYCRSRGIDESEAVHLIAEGFLADIYSGTPMESNIHPLIQNKICRI